MEHFRDPIKSPVPLLGPHHPLCTAATDAALMSTPLSGLFWKVACVGSASVYGFLHAGDIMTCPFRSLAIKPKNGGLDMVVSTLHLTHLLSVGQRRTWVSMDSSLGVMKVESRASGTAAVLTGTFERPSIHCLTEARYEGPWVLVLWPRFSSYRPCLTHPAPS